MRRSLFLLILFSAVLASSMAVAQYQSCIYCDVEPFDPDPFQVEQCDSGTIIVQGIGYRNTNVNGCDNVPDVEVRSTRPDRVQIVSFRVLNDRGIEVQYTVPCDAPEGLVGIDVTIDDDPSDSIIPYACGNARMHVDQRTLSVDLLYFRAVPVPEGVRIEWSTARETDSLGYFLYRGWGGTSIITPLGAEFIPAKGLNGGAEYSVIDPVPAVSATERYYILAEIDATGTNLYGPVTLSQKKAYDRSR